MYFVRAVEIDRVSAEDNYVGLWVQGRMHLLRETMKAIEARLDPALFVRVHRSAIVNLDSIAEIEPLEAGAFSVHLRDGSCHTVARRHRRQFLLRVSES
jgi:DNA-binding LytR/AlgR family response regulator